MEPMSWLFAAVALTLGVLIFAYRPHMRATIREIAVVTAAATGLGYLLFKPQPPKDIAALIERSSACSSPTQKHAERTRSRKSQRPRSGPRC